MTDNATEGRMPYLSERGTPYVAIPKPDGSTSVMLTNGKAAKRVKRDGDHWRSLDGQTFADLDAVADGMRWAL